MSLQFGLDNIAIGKSAKTTALYDIAIGTGASVSGNYSIAIGTQSSAAGDNSVVIGHGITTNISSQMILAPCTTANTIIIGNANTSATTIYGLGSITSAIASVSTINFDGIFSNSASYNTVQKCLDAADDHSHITPASAVSCTTGTFNGTFTTSDTNVQSTLDKMNILDLRYINTGNYAFGSNAGTNITGSYNIFIGDSAGISCTTNTYNIGIGPYTLYSITTKNINYDGHNCAIGFKSLYSLTSGYHNNCFGCHSGENITTGYKNTCCGYNSGSSITQGYGNVCIGYNANCSATATYSTSLGATANCTGNNAVAIGYGTTAGANTITIGYPIVHNYVINNTFTKFGSDALGIKCKTFTGTTNNNTGVYQRIETGLTNAKIISIMALIQNDVPGDSWVQPGMAAISGYESYGFTVWLWNSGAGDALYYQLGGVNVTSKAYRFTLFYTV